MKTSFICIIMILVSTVLMGVTDLQNFNNTSDLTTWFNPDATPVFTNISTGGLSNSGSVSIPIGSFDVWTGVYSFGLPSIGNQAVLSGYFLIGANSGYSGFGLATADVNEINNECNITTSNSLGVQFHGGGGAFFNNTASQNLDWFDEDGDLLEGSWYKITFTIDRTAESTFDLEMDIWLSDSDGVLQSRHTIQNWSCTNTDISAAAELYPYFCNASERSSHMDDFYVQAEEITLPVTMSSFTASVTASNFVMLQWITESESEMMGYNVHRSAAANLEDAIRMNVLTIPAYNNPTQSEYSYMDEEVDSEQTYYYWLESVELNGSSRFYGPQIVTVTETSEPDDTPEVVYATGIKSVFPNPFNPMTTISYSLASDQTVHFTMFDLKGRKVGEMTKQGNKGNNTVTWNAEGLSSGIYFIRMNAGGEEETRKVMLLK